MPTGISTFSDGDGPRSKVHENRLRRAAERQGYRLRKNPRRDPRAIGYGTWWLTIGDSGPVDPPRVDTFADIERFLTE